MPILNYNDFDSSGESTGGVTGSERRKIGYVDYQLKPSILNNPDKLRRLKAGDADRENLGEVIAAYIARGLFGTLNKAKVDGFEGSPEVFLVYDDGSITGKKSILVASKYFTGTEGKSSVKTLDSYIKVLDKELPIKGKKHAKFVTGTPDPNKREYNLAGSNAKCN